MILDVVLVMVLSHVAVLVCNMFDVVSRFGFEKRMNQVTENIEERRQEFFLKFVECKQKHLNGNSDIYLVLFYINYTIQSSLVFHILIDSNFQHDIQARTSCNYPVKQKGMFFFLIEK